MENGQNSNYIVETPYIEKIIDIPNWFILPTSDVELESIDSVESIMEPVEPIVESVMEPVVEPVEPVKPIKPNRFKKILHKAKKTIQTKKLNYFLIKK
jgi:hypothetical protein